MKYLLLILVVAFLAGCDGYLLIRGELETVEPAELPSDCRARIDDFEFYGENRLNVSDTGEFQSGWVVEPRRRTYQVVISCAGFAEVRKTAEYGRSGEPGQPIDIGKVRVDRELN